MFSGFGVKSMAAFKRHFEQLILIIYEKQNLFFSSAFEKCFNLILLNICFQSAKDYEQLRGTDNGSSCQRMYHWRRFANDSESANRV